MANALSDGYLYFTASDSGGVLTPISNYLHNASNFNVVDGNNDGNADTATDTFSPTAFPYSGYTINIGGSDYAIFGPNAGSYYVPYFNGVANLSGKSGDPVSDPITNTGENAVVVNLTCFAPGTRIATPSGERTVETLEIGDLITTADGRQVPVKWLGRQTQTAQAANLRLSAKAQPVRIRAGALGNGLPHSDLTVTADHGMIVDGFVINASALVNGTTIDWVPLAELGNSITVYHVETEAHDVILANGAPAETFLDAAGRAAFDNYSEYLDLYGSERIIREMPLMRISAQRLLPEHLRTRLNIIKEPMPDIQLSA